MKDSIVRPVGMFSPRRQRRLLDGLTNRFDNCREQLSRISQEHQAEKRQQQQSLQLERGGKASECSTQRKSMLADWDREEEKLIADYESTVIDHRTKLSRLSAHYRRKIGEQESLVEEKANSRIKQVQQECYREKNRVTVEQKKSIHGIDARQKQFHETLRLTRDVVLRRLDGLPEVATSVNENMTGQAGETLDEEARLLQCEKQLSSLRVALKTTKSAKVVDSWALPITGFLVACAWIAVATQWIPAPDSLPSLVWIGGGVVVAGVFSFVVYLLLMVPLKRHTTVIFTEIENCAFTFDVSVKKQRQVISKKAVQLHDSLESIRDEEIEKVEQWQQQQKKSISQALQSEQLSIQEDLENRLKQLDVQFSESYRVMGTGMRQQADGLANQIKQELVAVDQIIHAKQQELESNYDAAIYRLNQRLGEGIDHAVRRMHQTNQDVRQRFPEWDNLELNSVQTADRLDFLPVGTVRIGDWLRSLPLRAMQESVAGGSSQSNVLNDDQFWKELGLPEEFSIVLHRRLHSGLLISASGKQMQKAIDLAHQVLWRLLTGVLPPRSKLLLIDPMGRGQNFTNFMALSDHDPHLVGHRVWTNDENIESRLAEVAQHAEDVLQSSLRDRFSRIEDYNLVAGSLAVPYQAVAAVGFPDGLSRASHRHLNALIESGIRCGTFVVMVTDADKAWPADMPKPKSQNILSLEIDDQGSWRVSSDGLNNLTFVPEKPPSASHREQLVEIIGSAAINAARVEVPLRDVIDSDAEALGNSDDGLEIQIGTQGAGRPLSLRLGEGVKQHTLIAGKTGSGKSTLLHAIITSGAAHYRPDQLLFYLLDFKKGVEFKPYADRNFPHARVIGIESEREFGRSVLQRLDQELQERGEKFREAGVQKLGQYRAITGETLPRLVMIVDEFQELFVRDDRLASECTMLLDRIIRQGRSFGLHVILSSQSLAGAYSLPRSTLGQMAIRIAMQCSESDAALILSDDNTAARLIQRPGEAIYNDAGGLIEGNQPFQVAWLSRDEHDQWLQKLSSRDSGFEDQLTPKVVFDGNRPCRWTVGLANQAIEAHSDHVVVGLLGEAIEIGPPVTVCFTPDPGKNVLVVGAERSRSAVVITVLISILKSHPSADILFFDGSRKNDSETTGAWLEHPQVNVRKIKARDCDVEILRIEEIVKTRSSSDQDHPPMFIFVDSLERFRELRQEEAFRFNLDGDSGVQQTSVAFQNVLRDGPSVSVFVVLSCSSVETLSRWLPRASQRDLELRVLGKMNPADSGFLMDSVDAAQLSTASLLLYDDANGSVKKFRQCARPDLEEVLGWVVD
ncbi:FtsK/SpoIIIE domain-containing protein [bacterium]|nr:FtsK/SpoIIIE domain-containing protein [bacterium]